MTQRLQMVFEEIRSDQDFDRLKEVYTRRRKELAFAALRIPLDNPENPSYGVLIECLRVGPDAPDRFVAVIDCRGKKLTRRFFTRWHEIAHRLTTHADGGATEPAYRSEHDPIERMMDEIAGHIGFYEPLFQPALKQANKGSPLLTFRTVQTIINESFSAASFQATLFACARQLTTPVVYVEAALSHTKQAKQRLKTPSMFGDDPLGKLRAVKVIPNEAAKQDGFMIPMNMRVPEASVIHRLFVDEAARDGACREDLSWWESQGKRQEKRAIAVEASKIAERVIAIVQPVEPVRPKPQQPRAKGLFDE